MDAVDEGSYEQALEGAMAGVARSEVPPPNDIARIVGSLGRVGGVYVCPWLVVRHPSTFCANALGSSWRQGLFGSSL